MNKRQLINNLQNLALLLLAFSALFLLLQLFLFHGGLTVQAPLSPPAQTGEEGGGLAFPSVHMMVTGDSAYGRYGQMYAAGGDTLLQQAVPLLREALGSASEVGPAADGALREALNTPSLYLDLTCRLPLAAVAAWLEEDAYFDRSLSAMALTTEREDAATLYLLDGEGGVYRCYTALPVSAVQAFCAGTSPNGSAFAYESGHAALPPYSVLVAEAPAPPDVQAELPAGYSAYKLLTALDFNAHTTYRYTESSSGVEVVEESPRTLRIGPDGAVGYSGGRTVSSSLYRVGGSGGLPEVLQCACRLAEALTAGTGAAPLYLRAVEETGEGWRVRFQYQVAGIPVLFANGGDALTVLFSGGAVTGFQYWCRSYSEPQEEPESAPPLLPPAMAAAIAGEYPAARLAIGYVDGGSGRLSAQWLAQ